MSSFNLNYQNTNLSEIVDTRKLSFKTTGGLSFQKVWSLKNQKAKIVLVILLGFCSGCLNFFFVERVAIYNPGLLSIWQAIGRCVKSVSSEQEATKVVYLIFFWVFNSIINLVLALSTYKVIGKEMTRLSVSFIVSSSVAGLVLSYLPEAWKLKDFFLFSSPFSDQQQNSNGNANGKSPFLVWDETQAQPPAKSTIKNGIVILFLYAIVFSFLNALITSLLYALGGCGGGVDWIIFYLFRAKSYFANKLIFYTGCFFCIFSYITGSYIPWAVNGGSSKGATQLISNFFSPLFFALLISLLVRRFIFNVFYPRFKFINVKIFTNKFLDIRKELIERNFPHSFTIVPSFGSYSLRSQAQLEFICLLIELQELTKLVRTIDKDCFICSVPIRSLNARIKM